MKNTKNYIFGIFLIIIGSILTLNVLGITSINIFFKGWWTLLIIVPCFINLFKDEDKTGSLIGILIGMLLLLASWDIIDFSLVWKLILPIILITWGVNILFKDFINSKINKTIKKISNNKINKEISAVFTSENISYNKEEFTNVTLNSIFGSITLDLRGAKITNDTLIKATSIFGGIDILTDDDVTIKYTSTSIFGGVDYKTPKDGKKVIYLNATCLFGGVDIK